jgi:predicted MFS family arabinose efflux permease
VAVAALGAFFVWQRTTASPMLDLKFFEKPRFGLGSLGVTLTFLAMFSMFFVLTQYFQYVKGHTPLTSALLTLPFAVAMIAISPRATLIAGKLGLRTTVVLGVGLLSLGLFLFSFVGLDTPDVFVDVCLVFMAAGIAMSTPALTAGIITSVPMHKAGVGSAVNDTTREVGGAVGIAVIGSAVTSVYRSHLAPTLRLMESFGPAAKIGAEQAHKSVGRTPFVAKMIAQGPGGDTAAQKFLVAVHQAFVDGLHVGMRISAAIVLVSALLLLWKYPKNA